MSERLQFLRTRIEECQKEMESCTDSFDAAVLEVKLKGCLSEIERITKTSDLTDEQYIQIGKGICQLLVQEDIIIELDADEQFIISSMAAHPELSETLGEGHSLILALEMALKVPLPHKPFEHYRSYRHGVVRLPRKK